MNTNSNPPRQQAAPAPRPSGADANVGRIVNPSYSGGPRDVGRIINPSASAGVDTESALRLYQLCCAHLDREQAHLESARQVLRQVYAAGLESKPQRLAEMLPHQRDVARSGEALRLERDRFRADAGAMLGAPPTVVTVREVARHLPADCAQELLQRRRELYRLAEDAEKIGRDIALFSHYFLDFLQRFFIQLTGGTSSGRYGPKGLSRDPICGSLLQAQG